MFVILFTSPIFELSISHLILIHQMMTKLVMHIFCLALYLFWNPCFLECSKWKYVASYFFCQSLFVAEVRGACGGSSVALERSLVWLLSIHYLVNTSICFQHSQGDTAFSCRSLFSLSFFLVPTSFWCVLLISKVPLQPSEIWPWIFYLTIQVLGLLTCLFDLSEGFILDLFIVLCSWLPKVGLL